MKRIVSLLLMLVMIIGLCCACGTSGEAKIIDIPLSQEPYAFCVNKNDQALLQQVNEYLALIKTDGTFETICNNYFTKEGQPATIISAVEDPSKDQLIVATSTGFEPFEMVDNGKYSGIDLEIAAGLAKYLGKELVIQDMQFASVVTSVQQGKCDIGMAGLTITPEREEAVAFSDSYYNAYQTLVVPANNTEFDNCQTADDVAGILNQKTIDCKIGCQNGTTGATYIEGDDGVEGGYGFPGLPVTKMEFDYAALAITAMTNGEVDYVVVDDAPAKAITASLKNDFSDKWEIFWQKFIEGGAWKRVLGQGLINTLAIAIIGLIMGIVIGTPIASVKVMPKYSILSRILDKLCTVYVGFFRGTPIVVQLLLTYYVLFPLCGINIGSLYTCMLVFSLNSAAYISEIMRSGILSIDAGQMEAGRAVGLSYSTTMFKIVVPQAVKNILPTLGNELIALVKDTSVVSFVAAVDLYKTFTEIGNKTYEYIIPYSFMALIYIVLVAIISFGVKIMERSLRKSDRRN